MAKKQFVFVVTGDQWKEHLILGVTASKEKAEAIADKFAKDMDLSDISITKHEVKE